MRLWVAWYTRLFGFLSESALCAHDIMYVGHNYKKSLLGDNDSRCYLRKMKIISLDWIVLLRRLLIRNILLIRNYETSYFNLLKFPSF